MGNKRQERLFAILAEKKDWLTGKQLSMLLHVSDRTIRFDVNAINKGSISPLIESSKRKGYRIREEGTAAVDRKSTQRIPQTPEARCIYIIRKLLFEVKELNLTKLQALIYVGGSSLDNDLKRIRRMLEPYTGLKLSRNRECASLVGDESAKRRFYRDLLVAEIHENFLNLDSLAHLYESFDLIEVKDIFINVVKEYHYTIHESLFPMLILHVGTSIERISAFHYIQLADCPQGLEETIEYQISKTFYERISRRLHINIHGGEISMFALVIMGRRASNYTGDFILYRDKWLNIRQLAGEALKRVHTIFGVDYSNDEDLLAGLKMHVYSLIDRIKNSTVLEKFFLEEIKRKYPLLFEMGICVLEYLEMELETRIVEMEGGFIALHLGAASERMSSSRKYRTVFILHYNQPFSEVCRNKISDMFRERMEIVKVLSYFEKEEVTAEDPDLILTTFPIEHKLEIPTVPINLFVDTETEANILQALNRLDKKSFQLEFAVHIGNLIRREHYYTDLNLDTREAIIDYLCRDLEGAGIVEAEFKQNVMKREELSPTSFVNVLAIPHALGASAKKTTIAVAQLKYPVKWGNVKVKLVMLFAINEGEKRMIQVFFDWVSNMINSPDALAGLCVPCDYDTFIDRLITV